jgi:hypothetical protein
MSRRKSNLDQTPICDEVEAPNTGESQATAKALNTEDAKVHRGTHRGMRARKIPDVIFYSFLLLGLLNPHLQDFSRVRSQTQSI